MEISVKGMGSEQRKEYIKGKTQGNLDWVTTLTRKVDEGIITREKANLMIARAMTAREIITEFAKDKAKKDPLTDLYNKGAFVEEYERSISRGERFALLIIDIDNFKSINEKMGYLAGDSILFQTALNLSTHLRQLRENESENDFIARWGGEEFAVLLKNVSRKEDLETAAEKLRKVTCERAFSVVINGAIQDVPITVSIGGKIHNGEGKDAFFESVDKGALKQAKNTGKNRIVII